MAETYNTPWGEVTVAHEEVVLGLTNATLTWAWQALRPGMSKREYKQELINRGFEDYMADAILTRKWSEWERKGE